MKRHFVSRSGGTGSWYTGRRVIGLAQPGDEIHFVFADTKMEDEDLYRFLDETEERDRAWCERRGIRAFFHTLSDGRDVWQVFNDVRFLGNSRIDPCSKILKRDLIREFLEREFSPDDTICYIGIDWSEVHRFEKAVPYWLPYEVKAPLTEPPFVDKLDIHALLESEGVTLPRLYGMGFPHNNCGGFCVKAGMASFELLLKEMPERYAYHERKEQELREKLGKDVTILVDRSRKNILTRLGLTQGDIEKVGREWHIKATGEPLPKKMPLSLREFRERHQQLEVDPNDLGGCACFTPDDYAADEKISLGMPRMRGEGDDAA